MSNQDNYREMIDTYLTGNLSPEDSSRLMETLEQDPALKEEFLLQKDLVHSLQDQRRTELKNRLNQIEVGTGYTVPSALSLKFIAGAALVALLGTGTYFALNQTGEESEKTTPLVIRTEETPAAPAIGSTETAETEEVSVPSIPEENKATAAAEEEKAAPDKNPEPEEKPLLPKNQPKVTADENKELKPAADSATGSAGAEVVKPEVITFFDEQDPAGSVPLAEAPEDKLKNSRKFDTQNIEVSTKTDNRYPFHYMFFENKLNIYGDFSKVPYEVLEVNTGSQASYFLYHNGNYYELNPDQRKITRLKELTNERLIRELEVTRNEKLKH